MKTLRLSLLAALLCAAAGTVQAHEFWLQVSTHFAPPKTPVRLTIQRGEDFTGELRPINLERVAALRGYALDGPSDDLARVPAAPGVEFLDYSFPTPGTHLVALDSKPSTIVLAPEKFLSYLNSDGLEYVAAARKAAGKDNEPGRERYLRCVKTLVRTGPKSGAAYAIRTGQRLEIVPQSDPFTTKPGAPLKFAVYFDQLPLASGLVRAWHHRDGKLIVIKGRTAADGTITFELPYAGPWMVSLVHMIPLKAVPDLDWESYWGNLTFALAP